MMKHFLAGIGLMLVVASAWGGSAFQHRVLVHYQGPQPEKYLPPLEAVLTGDKLRLWVVASQLPGDASLADIVKEARRFASDIILSVVIHDSSGKDQVSWTLSSPVEAQPRATGSAVKVKPDWSAAADLYWLFLVKPLAPVVAPASAPWPPAAVAERVHFAVSGKPGTLLKGIPSGPVVISSSGVANVDVDIPVSLFLEGHLIGWRTQSERVFVDRADQTVALSQKLVAPWALTFSLNNLTFPSIGGEWSPFRSQWFVRVQLDQFLGGFYFANRSDANANPFPVQSLPLLTLQLGGGWYWSWPEDQLRFYTAADFGIRWMYPQFKVFSIEPVVPFTFEPLAGWDFRWADGQSVYFEVGPTLQWVPDADNFKASLKSNGTNFELPVPGVPLFVEFPLKAKVGYRWSF